MKENVSGCFFLNTVYINLNHTRDDGINLDRKSHHGVVVGWPGWCGNWKQDIRQFSFVFVFFL